MTLLRNKGSSVDIINRVRIKCKTCNFAKLVSEDIITCNQECKSSTKENRKVSEAKNSKGIRKGGWYWYFSDEKSNFENDKMGKWMVFYSPPSQKYVMNVCETAIDTGVCFECKCSATGKPRLICFYLNYDDVENHKRIIRFMIDNDLIRKTKDGRFYDISFKFDTQTLAGEYGVNFEGTIKLSDYINLYTGEWVYF